MQSVYPVQCHDGTKSIIGPTCRLALCNTFQLDQVNSANLLFELWSMDTVAMDIMIYDSTGPLQGSTGWYVMVLGHYGVILVVTRWYWVSITWYWLVLIGIEWYWVNKGLLCLYILKELMVTSTNQPTNWPTNRANIEQSAFSNVRKLKKGRDLQYFYLEETLWARVCEGR